MCDKKGGGQPRNIWFKMAKSYMKCGSPKVGWGGLGSNTYSSSLLRGLGATLLTPLGLIVGRPGVMFVG